MDGIQDRHPCLDLQVLHPSVFLWTSRHWISSAFLPHAAIQIHISGHLLHTGESHLCLVLLLLEFLHLSLFLKLPFCFKKKITPNFKLNLLLN